MRSCVRNHPLARPLLAVLLVLWFAQSARAQCSAPPVLESAVSCGQVRLSWNQVPTATGYVVRRGTSPLFSLSEPRATVDAGTATLIDDDGVPGQAYWYWVQATVPATGGCSSGITAASNFQTMLWQGFPAPAPTVVNTSATSCQIVIEWSIAPGSSGYEVWRSFTGNIDQAERVAQTDLFPRVLNDPEIPFGQSATYWVRGVSACGQGPFSLPLTVTRSYRFPEVPASFAAVAQCLGGVRLEWAPPPNTPVTSYNLQWARSDLGNFSSIDLPGDQTSFVPPNLSPGVGYVFFLTASNPCGLSQSALASVTAPTPQANGVPTQAPSLQVDWTSTAGCEVVLRWNSVGSTKSYRVHRSPTPAFADAEAIAIVPDPGEGAGVPVAYFDSTAPVGQTRWYWVRPFNPCAEGPLSNAVNGARTLAPPMLPGGVDAATPCDGRVVLAWTLQDGHNATRIGVAWSSAEDVEGGSTEVVIDGPLGSVLIEGLVSGASYVFELVSINACGESDPIQVQATVASPPEPPPAIGSAADIGGVLTAEIAPPPGQHFAYRWMKDGRPIADGGRISGAATHRLTIQPATRGDAGAYTVRIEFANGAPCDPFVSTPAFLAVRDTCPGDYDGSRVLDLLDLLSFLSDWTAGLGQNCP